MSSNILAEKDVNTAAPQQATIDANVKPEVKSMEHHRQMLAEKLAGGDTQQAYISPSDNIMSPCTAKLSAYRSKHVMKAKPKSLFAKTSSKKLGPAGAMFGDMEKPSQS